MDFVSIMKVGVKKMDDEKVLELCNFSARWIVGCVVVFAFGYLTINLIIYSLGG